MDDPGVCLFLLMAREGTNQGEPPRRIVQDDVLLGERNEAATGSGPEIALQITEIRLVIAAQLSVSAQEWIPIDFGSDPQPTRKQELLAFALRSRGASRNP